MPRFLAPLTLACALACLSLPAWAQSYPATLVRVVDGDMALVSVPAWSGTPFATMAVRISGIDTPESRKPPAKCAGEVVLGKAASAFAKAMVKPGDPVTFTYRRFDKYGSRLDGALTLPDGRDWATVMLKSGLAKPYGGGTKASWCRGSAPTSPSPQPIP